MSRNPNAAGLAINWQMFGSNGHEQADYSRGVLERFTCRAPSDLGMNYHVKTIANPRAINFITISHFPFYLDGVYSVNENAETVTGAFNKPVTVEKISVNHYHTKSREEFVKKYQRGRADVPVHTYDMKTGFESNDLNDVFDDGILRYRAARAKNFLLPSDAERLSRVTEALTKTLSAYSAGEKFSLETALTCRALSTYLRKKFSSKRWKVYEEASLAAVLQSTNDMTFADTRLLIRELPKFLALPYPTVDALREIAFQTIRQLMDFARTKSYWNYYVQLDYLTDILKLGG